MARTTKIAALSVEADRIIALLIIMLPLEATNRCLATTLPTSDSNQEEVEYDDKRPIDQLLSLQESLTESGVTSNNGSRKMMNSPDGIVRVELDMMFTEEQWNTRQNRINGSRHRRKAVVEPDLLWPNAIVPYVLIGSFHDSEYKILQRAMDHFRTFSCVRFRKQTSKDMHYVQITLGGDICASRVGRQNDQPQSLTLSPLCAKSFKTVVHELGHVLGFEHEHNRPDRDNFVTIDRSNVQPIMLHNFDKASTETIDIHEVPYDYLSIMHYSDMVFSKDRQLATIHAKNALYQKKMGTSNDLTFNDVKHLNKMYKCAVRNRCALRMKCPGDGFVGQDCKCYCPPPSSAGIPQPAVTCSECIDYDELCPLFRQRGFCTHRLFSDHMTYRCPQSCNRCTVNDITSSSTLPDPV